MKTKYYKFKRYLAVLLCVLIVVTGVYERRENVQAFALSATSALVIGALLASSGIAIANKDKIMQATEDFTSYISDKVPDAFKDFMEIVSSPVESGKIFVSQVLLKGFRSWAESKGWGVEDTPITSMPISSSVLGYFNASLSYLSDARIDIQLDVLREFISKANSSDYVLCSYNYAFEDQWFFLLPAGLTDIYEVPWFGSSKRLYGVLSNGQKVNLSDTFLGEIYRFEYYGVKNPPFGLYGISSGYVSDNLHCLISYKTFLNEGLILPEGIRLWSSEEAFDLQDEAFLVGVTGQGVINSNLDFTAVPEYQTPATSIPVNTIKDMTLDEFVAVIDKAIADNMSNYGDVLTGELIDSFVGDDVGTGEGSDSNPDEDDNKDPINNGDFIIPGLGIQWFTDLFDTVKDIPKNVVSGVQKAIDAVGDRVESLIDSIPDGFSKYFTSVTTAIKDIPSTFTDLFTDVKTAILDIPTSFKDYFDKLLDAVTSIDIPVLDAVIVSINNIPNALSSYFNSIVDAIKAIPGAISDYFIDVIKAIKAIPDAFKSWLEQIIDALTELCEVVGQFFVIDVTQINVAASDFVDVVSSHFVIFDQLREMAESAKQSFDNAYPIIYMKPPKVIKQFLDRNPGDIYVPDKGMIVLDLSEFAELFKWSRRISTSFFWFLTFRWLLRKFDFEIVITP